jgi:hypothetical protein
MKEARRYADHETIKRETIIKSALRGRANIQATNPNCKGRYATLYPPRNPIHIQRQLLSYEGRAVHDQDLEAGPDCELNY